MNAPANPSRHLSARQLRAIDKVGDVMLPGAGEFPRFSHTGCVREVDRILDYMPEQDLGDLKLLLSIFSLFPKLLLSLILKYLEIAAKLPGPGILRLIRLGLRGLIMSLYYGHASVHKSMDYRVGVFLDDLSRSEIQ